MPDLTAGRFRYEDRYSVLAAIEQAVANLTVPDAPDGAVSVIVRVTAPQTEASVAEMGPPIPVGTAPLTIKERWAACGVGMDRAELAFRYEATLHQQKADIAPEQARGCATAVTG